MRKLELLAPAQNLECAKAAVDFGADAVYLGAHSFGARSKAANALSDIIEAVQYAHRFGVRVYVTLNTILDDNEILEAKKLIDELYEAGVDAIIIQDMGIFELDLPPIPLFMSTQCDNRTLEKVKFFEQMGISRVILARELTLEQISHIAKNTKIELESFIHGALCVCYSGQCYLSFAMGGRSANRGECAQPCRKKYTLVDEQGKELLKDKHPLNLKDFSASKHLDSLVKAGVTSFKIEGRLKDVNYVKNVVGYYRKLLDKYPKTSSGKVFFDFEPNIEKSFNRGFSDYFLKGKSGSKIADFKSPKSKGEELGKVKEVGKDYFTIATNKKISPQDGLFTGQDGCLVNKVLKERIYPNKMPRIKTGDVIFRNLDFEFEKALKNSKTSRKLGVKFEVGENFIKATDEDKNEAIALFEVKETAQNQDRMREALVLQLSKCGESDFFVQDIAINPSKLPFLPVGEINKLRREVLYDLMSDRLKCYKCTLQKPLKPAKYPLKEGDWRLNVHNRLSDSFFEKCDCLVLEKSLESGTPCANKELMRCKYCIKRELDICKQRGKLFLYDEQKRRLELEFDCKNCEMTIKTT